jgi:hypothetical protein
MACVGEELGARRCKPGKDDVLSRKQADGHLFFQPGYLFGERRLRDLQSMGGAGDSAPPQRRRSIGDAEAQHFRAEYHQANGVCGPTAVFL